MRRQRKPLLVLLALAVICVVAAVVAVGGAAGPDDPRSSDDTPDAATPQNARRPRMGAVSGRVLTRAGAPVPDCGVIPQATSEPRPAVPEMALMSDTAGRYRWALPPATYTLTAHCTDPGSGDQITGKATGIELAPGPEVTADITVG